MNSKLISIISVSLAVVAAAVAAIVVSANRADEAKAYAEAEAAAEDAAKAEEKAARAQKDAEIAKQKTAEANKEAKDAELAAQRLAKETAEIEAKTAADNKAAAEKNVKARQAEADAQRAVRDAAKLTNETARVELQKAKELAAAEREKAEAEAAKLAAQKLQDERVIAEAEMLKHRQSDYEALERDLLEWKLDLEERERALKPEKTIADLAWAGGTEDTVIDEKGNLKKQVKTVYDPEKDMSVPEQTRRLARAERKIREGQGAKAAAARSTVVKSMEKLYVEALKEGRVIDADYYRKGILVMYPDWKFQDEKADESAPAK